MGSEIKASAVQSNAWEERGDIYETLSFGF